MLIETVPAETLMGAVRLSPPLSRIRGLPAAKRTLRESHRLIQANTQPTKEALAVQARGNALPQGASPLLLCNSRHGAKHAPDREAGRTQSVEH